MKKWIIILLAAAVLAGAVTGILLMRRPQGPLQVFDSAGTLCATLESLEQPGSAYLEIVLDEAVQLLAQLEGWDTEKAKQQLTTGGYRIETAWDAQIQQAMENAWASQQMPMGSAVTDLQGRLVAVYSSSKEGNYAALQTPPYSSFKPLSVYAPALEAGLIDYSSVFTDEPLRQVEGKPWPSNSTGSYSYGPVTVTDAVARSLNTVAVSCMEQLGLENAFAFLRDRFDLALVGEENRAASLGEKEVSGNIALGYLDYGVTPVQMAGYYQCFGNGGSYTQPKTVMALYRGEKCIYTFQPEQKQVLTAENAAIMNQLLQKVVEGGTGKAARLQETVVAGKTGTGDRGCWFVGVTPGYSCAVWHGDTLEGNVAAALFSQAVSQFHSSGKDFPVCDGVENAVYCAQSGMLAGPDCSQIGKGIYAKGELPQACNINH